MTAAPAAGRVPFRSGPTAARLSPREAGDSNPIRSIKVMTSRRIAQAGFVGSAIAGLALLSIGWLAPPKFGDPLQGLTPDQLARFQTGKVQFMCPETPQSGLGPVFNDTACFKCHTQGAIGGGNDRLETRYG